MCLILDRFALRRESPQKVFKIYQRYHSQGRCYSPYRGEELLLDGVEKVSSRGYTDLTVEEMESGRVSFGFHVFLNLDNVQEFLKRSNSFNYNSTEFEFVVAQLEVQPDDFVASGTFDSFDIPMAVYNRMTFEKFVASVKKDGTLGVYL